MDKINLTHACNCHLHTKWKNNFRQRKRRNVCCNNNKTESSEEAKKQTKMYTTNWIELDYFVRLFNHNSRREREREIKVGPIRQLASAYISIWRTYNKFSTSQHILIWNEQFGEGQKMCDPLCEATDISLYSHRKWMMRLWIRFVLLFVHRGDNGKGRSREFKHHSFGELP